MTYRVGAEEDSGAARSCRQRLPSLGIPTGNQPENQPKDYQGDYQSKEAANSKEAAPAEVPDR